MNLDQEFVSRVICPRPQKSHKGDFGRVLLIGGLYPYGGAIIMSAIAAVKSGAGLVTVATDKENIIALHSHLPEAMGISVDDQTSLEKAITEADILLIGPGLGEDSRAYHLFKLVVDSCSQYQSLIIDGSALSLLAREDITILENKRLVLTPHQKEWERLSAIPIDEQTTERSQKALTVFPEGSILVAKSEQTKIITHSEVAVLTIGGSYQATGGMGDTLAGLIAGFLAQFRQSPPFQVVAAATYLHSAIAKALSSDHYVVLPTQISQEVPKWMKKFVNQEK
ncbi:NAD(P)H-hydrate dehydratase [Streptococcus hongkongensis]